MVILFAGVLIVGLVVLIVGILSVLALDEQLLRYYDEVMNESKGPK